MPYLITLFFLFFSYSAIGSVTVSPIPDVIKSSDPVPEVSASSWLLVDYETGWILAEENADKRIEPASLTKLMTSYLVFDALASKEVKLSDEVYISKAAWQTGGSRMFLQVDTHVTIGDLIKGLIIQSGNDASVALAEHLGGSQAGFAKRMNRMAEKLGMTNSHFTNSSGLPDEDHYSTAKDMTILSISLIEKFPEYYVYYSEKEFTYNNITQKNRNVLLWRDASVDGVKTGYTQRAGYCLIGSAKRDGMRLVAVVAGASSKKQRANMVQSLLQFGYSAYETLVLYRAGAEVKSLPLWMGKVDKAKVGLMNTLSVLFPKGQSTDLSALLKLPESLEAPLNKGKEIGSINIKFAGEPVLNKSLHVVEGYAEGSLVDKVMSSVKRFLH
ncbi:MAG: serine-type D-Ala-D-Ala carboxypeptidase [Gammaproteobacteria bacterium]|nr:serine-type D-Ala-D-Ala carboxypeptidase [Gammaproteobacteria bacterium]